VCPQAVLQEDLHIAGMAECDIWTIFFMFAVCFVNIDTCIYFSATDKPQQILMANVFQESGHVHKTYEESTPPKISRCVM
jgi:hypothetical protein